MTQEIIIAVLLTGLVGLIWVMTLSVLDNDYPTSKNRNVGTQPDHRDGAHSKMVA